MLPMLPKAACLLVLLLQTGLPGAKAACNTNDGDCATADCGDLPGVTSERLCNTNGNGVGNNCGSTCKLKVGTCESTQQGDKCYGTVECNVIGCADEGKLCIETGNSENFRICSTTSCAFGTDCDGITPICELPFGFCLGCTPGTAGDEACRLDNAGLPFCNDNGSGSCVQCNNNAECAGNANGLICLANICVECTTAAECTTATAPVCSASNQCEPCTVGDLVSDDNALCRALNGPNDFCLQPEAEGEGSCVQCLVDIDCLSGANNDATCTGTNTCTCESGNNYDPVSGCPAVGTCPTIPCITTSINPICSSTVAGTCIPCFDVGTGTAPDDNACALLGGPNDFCLQPGEGVTAAGSCVQCLVSANCISGTNNAATCTASNTCTCAVGPYNPTSGCAANSGGGGGGGGGGALPPTTCLPGGIPATCDSFVYPGTLTEEQIRLLSDEERVCYFVVPPQDGPEKVQNGELFVPQEGVSVTITVGSGKVQMTYTPISPLAASVLINCVLGAEQEIYRPHFKNCNSGDPIVSCLVMHFAPNGVVLTNAFLARFGNNIGETSVTISTLGSCSAGVPTATPARRHLTQAPPGTTWRLQQGTVVSAFAPHNNGTSTDDSDDSLLYLLFLLFLIPLCLCCLLAAFGLWRYYLSREQVQNPGPPIFQVEPMQVVHYSTPAAYMAPYAPMVAAPAPSFAPPAPYLMSPAYVPMR